MSAQQIVCTGADSLSTGSTCGSSKDYLSKVKPVIPFLAPDPLILMLLPCESTSAAPGPLYVTGDFALFLMENVALVIRCYFNRAFVCLGVGYVRCLNVDYRFVPRWRHSFHAIKNLFIASSLMCTFIRAVAPSVICLPLFLWLVFLSTSRLFLYFPDIFKSGFWNFDQDALQDGSIQGLADRLKTTVLSAKANSTSLLYYRAYRKWKQFAICMFGGGGFARQTLLRCIVLPNPFP